MKNSKPNTVQYMSIDMGSDPGDRALIKFGVSHVVAESGRDDISLTIYSVNPVTRILRVVLVSEDLPCFTRECCLFELETMRTKKMFLEGKR